MIRNFGIGSILVIVALSLVLAGCESNVTGQTTKACGNGVCDRGENVAKCPEDCAASTVCGNGVCESGEDYQNCPVDCEQDPCGDGVCEGSEFGEDCNACAADCTKELGLPAGSCDACFKGVCDGSCNSRKEGADCSDCAPREVLACCGDGVCEGSETVFSCVTDCGCIPSEEVCDGVDNDCDNVIDEDLAQVCGVSSIGDCQLGTSLCTQGVWSACQGNIDPVNETCDGIHDEDCDGVVDDGCACTNGLEQGCGSDVGACAHGTQTCLNGLWGACVGEVGPTTEICDGIDNDCDTIVDDGLQVMCDINSDCGNGGWTGYNYCGTDGNVHMDWITYTCQSAGTCGSTCLNQTTDYIYQYCGSGCVNGVCLPGTNQTNST